MALGLGYWRMMGLVVLPQALTLVIPGIVNNFIGLFKDTTLVAIVGMLDFLRRWTTPSRTRRGAARRSSPTGYAFAGAVLFRLLLWDVALFLGDGAPARRRAQALKG